MVEFSKSTRERATDHARPKNTDPHFTPLASDHRRDDTERLSRRHSG